MCFSIFKVLLGLLFLASTACDKPSPPRISNDRIQFSTGNFVSLTAPYGRRKEAELVADLHLVVVQDYGTFPELAKSPGTRVLRSGESRLLMVFDYSGNLLLGPIEYRVWAPLYKSRRMVVVSKERMISLSSANGIEEDRESPLGHSSGSLGWGRADDESLFWFTDIVSDTTRPPLFQRYVAAAVLDTNLEVIKRFEIEGYEKKTFEYHGRTYIVPY